jgi:Spy/CpxP family protein refolding chaperone
MKVKLLVGALALLIVMNLAALGAFLVVQTHHRSPMGWHHGGDRGAARMGDRGGARARLHDHLMGQLGPEERKKLFASMKEFHEKNGDMMRQTHMMEEDAIASMRQDPVPRAHIDSLLQQISANRLEIARHATDQMIALGKTLTPDQREHLMDAIMHMRGDGPPGPPPDGDDDPSDQP